MSALEQEVLKLPKLQKISMMEKIWEDLSRNFDDVDLPKWHAQELAESEVKIDRGEAEFVDWDVAKREVRDA